MQKEILSQVVGYGTSTHDTSLVAQFLNLRKKVFIDALGWDVPQASDYEFDQYDTPHSRIVLVTLGKRIVAGMRLIPSTARVGIYSYMLRDAQDGKLPGLPDTVLSQKAPVSETVWEGSRVFILPDIPRKLRYKVREMLLHEMLLECRRNGVDEVICLVPTWWPKLRLHGISIHAIGPEIDIGGPYQAVCINASQSSVGVPGDRSKMYPETCDPHLD